HDWHVAVGLLRLNLLPGRASLRIAPRNFPAPFQWDRWIVDPASRNVGRPNVPGSSGGRKNSGLRIIHILSTGNERSRQSPVGKGKLKRTTVNSDQRAMVIWRRASGAPSRSSNWSTY